MGSAASIATLADVLNYIANALTGISPSADKAVKDFLDELYNGDISSKRLLICLGIDLKTYYNKFAGGKAYNDYVILLRDFILKAKSLNPVPKSFPSGKIPPHLLFGEVKRSSRATPPINCSSNVSYFRITTFRSYIIHTVMDNQDVNTHLPPLLNKKLVDNYYEDFINNNDFGIINVARLSSKTGWIFVADTEEMETYITKKDINFIVNSLGFYLPPPDADEVEPYISVGFSPDFNEPTYQPNVLTGDWGASDGVNIDTGNDYFMSFYHFDEWGRTFSVSGTMKPLKERVLLKFDALLNSGKVYQINIRDLGRFTGALSKATDALIETECRERFTKS